MKCPICGGNNLVHDIRDIPFVHENKTTIIKSIEGDFCPDCEEVILDGANGDRLMAEMNAVRRQAA